ncbi:MAG: universal stress protein [Paracoccaceae bacterium]
MGHPVLVPVDVEHEESWRLAMPAAQAEARRRGAELHLIAVLPDFGMSIVGQFFPKGFSEDVIHTTHQALEKIAAEMLGDTVTWKAHVHQGEVTETILSHAAKLHAGLIVMAAHAPGERGFLAGTHADRVVARAECSVLVVRAGTA